MSNLLKNQRFITRSFKPLSRRHKAGKGECKSCDEFRAEGLEFHPSHDASLACQSGRRPHCTCDECF